MKISRQADYAVRAVCELSLLNEGQRLTAAEIAERQDIPRAFLMRILARLSGEGIVDSQRGVGGGVRLARPARRISMLDVVEAVDGPITLNRCVWRPQECPRVSTCAVHPVWRDICSEFRERLAQINFDSIVSKRTSLDAPPRRTSQ